jgi:hypothetical protein
MIDDDRQLPDPRPPRKHPPLMEHSFAALGWLNRAAQSVGSDRFFEVLERAQFCLNRANMYTATPAEQAIVEGLDATMAGLIEADRQARRLLHDSVSDMNAAEAAEFIERIEAVE